MTYANTLVQPTIQHNTPISKGGEHELGNISVMCRSCNSSIRDKETGELNSREVADMWDKICELEGHGIDWFHNTSLLCQAVDSQVTDMCQPNDSIGKVSVGEVSVDKSRLVESTDTQTDELQPIIDFCNNNVEILTPFKLQMLESYVSDYGYEWVQKGLEKLAGLDRTKQNVRYLGGVLEGWKKDNVPKPWEQKQQKQNNNGAGSTTLYI
jgi:DnaD/phage-associated family protein